MLSKTKKKANQNNESHLFLHLQSCLSNYLFVYVSEQKKNSDVMFIVKLVKTRLTILRSLENNI